ncbi:hypothetical protein [Flavihumibacter sp. UBA7668]|uniref:hypothetical protein n=1 Tax=Flavihumibacter sp. UBA7668 TaxID=1946542 RepID=UPI0025BBC8AA|nr:hypothetical protein [Flavihumibacter sp. UBA7668]
MQIKDLLIRIDFVISKGTTALAHKKYSDMGSDYVETGQYAGFRSSSMSVISSIFGESHTYFKEFDRQVNNSYVYNIEAGINILQSLRHEVEQGWLTTFKKLVTAEVFSDFLEMSKYFLDESYKDPAAVMIGSVLEENLRQLCNNHSVDTFIIKGSDTVNKKADQLNVDLAKAGVYGVLEQKSVTAWLDLRNRAAHGKYNDYTIEQVKLMYQGVFDFITRIQ